MERKGEDRPPVLEGDDEPPRQPPPDRDPYTPEPGPSPGERKAFRLLPLVWIVVFILAGILVYAALR
jgi:hypothetical protein